jgi:predicted ATP-grasp superfamily ATP-dependent carboligase
LVEGSKTWKELRGLAARETWLGDRIAQAYVQGLPASIAFIVGQSGVTPLPATEQILSRDGHFRYQGGIVPLHQRLLERALTLGKSAIQVVTGLRGYVGIDLILGDAKDGSQDFVIEINARLTTSYVGYRALAKVNLAAALLSASTGKRAPTVSWRPGAVRFDANGRHRSIKPREPSRSRQRR